MNESDRAHVKDSRFKAINQIPFKRIKKDIIMEGDGETLNRI
jgi:hypothetical protein